MLVPSNASLGSSEMSIPRSEREGAVVQLHRRALGGLDRVGDLQQPEADLGVRAEHLPRGDAEEEGVADLAGRAGDSDVDGAAHACVSLSPGAILPCSALIRPRYGRKSAQDTRGPIPCDRAAGRASARSDLGQATLFPRSLRPQVRKRLGARLASPRSSRGLCRWPPYRLTQEGRWLAAVLASGEGRGAQPPSRRGALAATAEQERTSDRRDRSEELGPTTANRHRNSPSHGNCSDEERTLHCRIPVTTPGPHPPRPGGRPTPPSARAGHRRGRATEHLHRRRPRRDRECSLRPRRCRCAPRRARRTPRRLDRHAQRLRGAIPRPLSASPPSPAGSERPAARLRRGLPLADTPGWSSRSTAAPTHGTRRAFQADRDRDGRLSVAGYRVLRFTWFDVTRRPAVVADRVRRLLATAA